MSLAGFERVLDRSGGLVLLVIGILTAGAVVFGGG